MRIIIRTDEFYSAFHEKNIYGRAVCVYNKRNIDFCPVEWSDPDGGEKARRKRIMSTNKKSGFLKNYGLLIAMLVEIGRAHV